MRVLGFLFFTFAACFTFSAPVFAQQADTCSCYCSSVDGAVDRGELASIDACRTACDAGNLRTLGCYQDVHATPEHNRLCWTEGECTADTVRIGDELVPSVWGGQEAFCPAQKGYCYPPRGAGGSTEVVLGVPIAGLTEVSDIGTYIKALYSFLLALGSIIAVIVVMGAGLTWLLSAGNPTRVAAAKAMIGNAVLGIVLLLTAYSIGRLIDPSLVRFGIFAAPKVKEVIFIDNDCNVWRDVYGIQVTGLGNSCGDKGVATSIDNATQGVAVEVGDECLWTTCTGILEQCVQTDNTENGYSCVRCSDVFDDFTGLNGNATGILNHNDFVPSAGLCQLLVDQDFALQLAGSDRKLYCEYYNAPLTGVETDACFELVYPQSDDALYLNCNQLERASQDYGGASCRMYDEVYAVGIGRETIPGVINNNQIDDKQGQLGDYPLLNRVCNSDPCGFAPPGQTCQVTTENFCLNPDPQFASLCFFDVSTVNSFFADGDCVNSGFFNSGEVKNAAGQQIDYHMDL